MHFARVQDQTTTIPRRLMPKKRKRKITKQKKQQEKELLDMKDLLQEVEMKAAAKNMVLAGKSLQQNPNQRKFQKKRSRKDQRLKEKPKKEKRMM